MQESDRKLDHPHAAGYFEICSARELSGWAVGDQGTAALKVYIDNIYYATVVCDLPRADISAPNAGFVYRIPAGQRLPPAAGVSIRMSDGAELDGSPRRVPRHEGYIETFTGNTITGWAAWDDKPAALDIYLDGVFAARIQCGLVRRDVAAQECLPENTGFNYEFSEAVSETAIVTVYFPDGTPLGDVNGASAMDALSRRAYFTAVSDHRARVRRVLETIEATLYAAEDRPSALEELRRLRSMRRIIASGLFDADFYLRDNPDVRDAGDDPLDHYVRYGDKEGRRPNAMFWPSEYWLLNGLGPAAEGLNALAHFAEEGERRGFRASLAFDPNAYLAAHEPLAEFVGRPLFHFLQIGQDANLSVRKPARLPNRRRVKSRMPRIAAQLEVKDEAEIIEQSIAHLYAIGVDHIIVVDIGSTDGTAEIIEKHRSDDFWVTRLTDRAVSIEATPEDIHAFERYKSAPADWVMLLDADEFWIPASGNIKECEALDLLDVLSVQRYNIPLGRQGPMMPSELVPGRYDDLLLIANTTPDVQKQLVTNPETPWILGAAEPKVMVRPKMVSGTIMGNHDVVETDAPLRRAKASDLLVAHLPLTSRRRFERKVANICAWFARDGVDLFSGSGTWQNEPLAWHWRRWAALARDGKIGEEFDRNTFDEAQIANMRNQGRVLSAAELLARGCVVPSKT